MEQKWLGWLRPPQSLSQPRSRRLHPHRRQPKPRQKLQPVCLPRLHHHHQHQHQLLLQHLLRFRKHQGISPVLRKTRIKPEKPESLIQTAHRALKNLIQTGHRVRKLPIHIMRYTPGRGMRILWSPTASRALSCLSKTAISPSGKLNSSLHRNTRKLADGVTDLFSHIRTIDFSSWRAIR